MLLFNGGGTDARLCSRAISLSCGFKAWGAGGQMGTDIV